MASFPSTLSALEHAPGACWRRTEIAHRASRCRGRRNPRQLKLGGGCHARRRGPLRYRRYRTLGLGCRRCARPGTRPGIWRGNGRGPVPPSLFSDGTFGPARSRGIDLRPSSRSDLSLLRRRHGLRHRCRPATGCRDSRPIIGAGVRARIYPAIRHLLWFALDKNDFRESRPTSAGFGSRAGYAHVDGDGRPLAAKIFNAVGDPGRPLPPV
jgi:hypothetical protein